MKELQPGMWARNKEGKIKKLTDEDFEEKQYDVSSGCLFLKEIIATPLYLFSPTNVSDNILDLIEEQDIVNGILIESIYERTKEHLLCHTFDEEIMFEITKDNIDYILTKEEIERRKYEVE